MYVVPEDFRSLFKAARDASREILSPVQDAGATSDYHANIAASSRCREKARLDQAALNSITDEYNTNFLGALMFGESSEKPQMYKQLQPPEELHSLRFNSSIHRKSFLLQTNKEKTARSTQLGGVVFSKPLLSHLTAHM